MISKELLLRIFFALIASIPGEKSASKNNKQTNLIPRDYRNSHKFI